jgi:two-component system, response regulator
MTDRTILLVEDNPDDVELMVRAFRGQHSTVHIHVARDGGEALDFLLGTDGRPPVTPAVVLLDLKLPGIDGFEVLRRIRNDGRTRLLPVVVLTSSAEPGDLTNAYLLGANSYVRKPMSFRNLLPAVEQIAAYWLQLNERPRSSFSYPAIERQA